MKKIWFSRAPSNDFSFSGRLNMSNPYGHHIITRTPFATFTFVKFAVGIDKTEIEIV